MNLKIWQMPLNQQKKLARNGKGAAPKAFALFP